RKLADEGVAVYIACGTRPGVLVDLIRRPAEVPHTLFVPAPDALSTVKRWIAHSASFAKGVVRVDAKAAEALLSDRPTSLLPVGVTAVEGEWEEGDIVTILGPSAERVAVGRASLSSAETAEAMGLRGQRPVVHYDYLYTEN
ncbi:MAG: glutamate 5-kinase, partial [Duncaniella sp.]|nr:glutamate 5-kinase [Duncaniella sp.]